MRTTTAPRVRFASLLAALASAAAVAAVAAATASAQGPLLFGQFGFDTWAAHGTSYYHQCGPPANPGFTIVLTDGLHPVTTLRPGTYWLVVTDNCANHDFVLRSCPGSSSPCGPSSGGTEQQITPLSDPRNVHGIPGASGIVIVPLHLVPGTYRLLCDALTASGKSHEVAFNMYTDFSVGWGAHSG
jgi:hypothetical protein